MDKNDIAERLLSAIKKANITLPTEVNTDFIVGMSNNGDVLNINGKLKRNRRADSFDGTSESWLRVDTKLEFIAALNYALELDDCSVSDTIEHDIYALFSWSW